MAVLFTDVVSRYPYNFFFGFLAGSIFEWPGAVSVSVTLLVMLILTCIVWGIIRAQIIYEVRIRKFAAVNAFRHTLSINTKSYKTDDAVTQHPQLTDVIEVISKHDKELVEGSCTGVTFRMGIRETWRGSGDSTGVERITFFRVRLKRALPHMALLGDGRVIRTINADEYNRVSGFNLRLEEAFRIYCSKEVEFQKYIPPKIQAVLCELRQDTENGMGIDIDINNKFITFYWKKRPMLELVPKMLEIAILLNGSVSNKKKR